VGREEHQGGDQRYRRYAAEKPGDFEVHHTLAQLLARGDPRSAEAISLYKSLVAARPEDHGLRLEYVHLLSADPNRRLEAIEEYRTLVAKQPTANCARRWPICSRPDQMGAPRLAAVRGDPAREAGDTGVRLKYAQMLAANREDTPEPSRSMSDLARRSEERRGALGARPGLRCAR